MKNILELLYDQPSGVQAQDSPFVRTARIRNENMELLKDTLSGEQKELLNTYFDVDTKVAEIINFDRFRYAFHLGAQLMAELIEGKEELLK